MPGPVALANVRLSALHCESMRAVLPWDQVAGFAALGWGTPPQVGELMRRMVEYVEDEAPWYARVERSGGAAHHGGKAAPA